MKKVAVFISHPIQYHAPLFKRLAVKPEIDLKVFFFWDYGVRETYDPKFKQKVKWDIPLLDGYNFEFLKNVSPNKTSANFFGQINPGLIKRLVSGKYDAVIIFGWQTFSHYLAIFSAFLLHIPIFIRGENPYNQEIIKPFLKKFLKKILLGTIFKMARGFFYIGEENKKFYKYYGVPEKKLFFVPYAVDNERFQKEDKKFGTPEEKSKTRKDLGIVPEKIIILFAGKLIPLKRPFDLIKAHAKMLGKTSLLFVGDGPLKQELEKFVKDSGIKDVYFLGFVNQGKIGRYYAVADIFVLLSDSETWGVVVNEIMNFSKPVVVSDVVGCGADLVKQGENGYVFSVGNINDLINCLNRLLDPAKRKKFGKHSLEIVNGYSYSKGVEKIMEVLQKI